jgi:antitoxin component YwqK of YwqJK toxin-antitoxin module
MKKTVVIFLLGLMCFQTVKAQKRDTVLLYMTNHDEIVQTKDSADYLLQIIMPPDMNNGVKINSVKEFYLDGNQKLIGTAIIIVNDRVADLKFVGPRIDYYLNGRKKSITNYKNGFTGVKRLFFSQGGLYTIEDMTNPVHPLFIECHDTTGNILSKKGNGNWIKYDKDFKNKIEEGAVQDSLQEGEWHELVNDSIKYITIYKNGEPISSTDPNCIFDKVEKEPYFKTGSSDFMESTAKALKFPAFDIQYHTWGKIIITFVVEKDGSLSNVIALRGPTQTIMDAAIEAVKQSPKWIPGVQNGLPARTRFTVSFKVGVESDHK